MSIDYLAINAIRVPPIQFQHYTGASPHLITTDILSGCGGLSLPPALAAIAKMLMDDSAYVYAIASSTMNQINAAIGAATSQLNGLIANATSSLGTMTAQLTAQAAAIGGTVGPLITAFIGTTSTAVGGVIGQHSGIIGATADPTLAGMNDGISTIVGNMPSLAGMVSNVGQLNASLGLPAPPSLNSIFGPVVNGGLNTALAPVLAPAVGIQTAVAGTIAAAQIALFSAVQGIISAGTAVTSDAIAAATTAVNAALSTITTAASAATSAFSTAVTAVAGTVNGLVAGMNATINGVMSTLVHTVNAAAMSVVCAAATELNGFINSITTPAFQALLPAPI